MIQVILSKNDFEYDIRSLVKAFLPEEEIKFEVKSFDEQDVMNDESVKKAAIEQSFLYIQYKEEKVSYIWIEDGRDIRTESRDGEYSNRKVYKNILKRLLYHLFSGVTDKQLPWGTLTGIRPTKLPMEKLENGESDEEILKYLESEYLCSKEKAELSLFIAKKEFKILNEIDDMNGYSIYIGIPFCPSTCLYCSFTSFSIEKYDDYVDKYLEALFKEIDYAKNAFPNKKLTTIYVGGGTPTTLNEERLEKLLKKITSSFNFTFVKEFTVEAGRPDSITMDKLKILKENQVTRISINPQSMRQKTLDLIGRKHTVEQIEKAFTMAREAGHDNINMDIILGLPGETVEDVAYTLDKINEMNPDSITVHTLAIKRAAFLNIYKDKYKDYIPSDTVAMIDLTYQYAKEEAYEPYYLYRQKNMADNLENIGYARKEKEGIYNILIMEERHPIIALGAGASSKFVFPNENRIERVENVKSIKDYVERIDEMIRRKHNFLSEYQEYFN
ncbi:coproporphyrinogen dehydrogenase HemZ [Anaeromicropila herbilytica]|uniref:Coproporphyrinogen III oxidase n=1 Tax=Anaeromicropila herbilytica TaxID=2785025 RepID=A0A7R7EJT9_9FIRM|nr:coproporphyrinogen dehydrogenase HemZ [Anaeromicropila herbilytica]BCN29926.1 coproporphyrinogen III oxidase [Anaeromicropila herbilytica]